MRKAAALILSTLLLAGCGEPVKLNPPPPPPERMVCAALPAPPRIDGLMAYEVGEGMAYDKGQVDARDANIARWIVSIRDAWFECSNQLAWIREYYAAQ